MYRRALALATRRNFRYSAYPTLIESEQKYKNRSDTVLKLCLEKNKEELEAFLQHGERRFLLHIESEMQFSDLVFLTEVLRTNNWIKELDFYCAGLSDITPLAEMLKYNTTIKKLNLAKNDINPAGAMLLSEALEKNTTLEELRLRDNSNIGKGLAYIARSLKANKTLRVIDLRNTGFDHSTIVALSDALTVNVGLYTLWLGDPSDQSNDSHIVPGDLKAGFGIALAKFLEKNTTLRELCMRINFFHSEDIEAFINALSSNTTLTELDMTISYEQVGLENERYTNELTKLLDRNKKLSESTDSKVESRESASKEAVIATTVMGTFRSPVSRGSDSPSSEKTIESKVSSGPQL